MRWLKIALSVFLVYHLATVLLMPISSSILGRRLGDFFLTYANTLNFHTTWQFFSPGPTPMFYLEYEVEKAGDREGISAEPSVYPPKRSSHGWNDGWNRRLFAMRYFALNGDGLTQFFVPYLCRQNPGAEAISLRGVVERVEDIERAGEIADFSETKRFDLPRQRISCPDGSGG